MATILSAQQKWNIKVLMALILLVCYHNSLCISTYLLWAALELDPPSLLPGSPIICHPSLSLPDRRQGIASSSIRQRCWSWYPPSWGQPQTGMSAAQQDVTARQEAEAPVDGRRRHDKRRLDNSRTRDTRGAQ
jgi:hypothetical protein